MVEERALRPYADAVAPAVVTPRAEPQAAATPPTRRQFLTRSTGTGLALLLAGLPRGWVGEVYASDAIGFLEERAAA